MVREPVHQERENGSQRVVPRCTHVGQTAGHELCFSDRTFIVLVSRTNGPVHRTDNHFNAVQVATDYRVIVSHFPEVGVLLLALKLAQEVVSDDTAVLV